METSQAFLLRVTRKRTQQKPARTQKQIQLKSTKQKCVTFKIQDTIKNKNATRKNTDQETYLFKCDKKARLYLRGKNPSQPTLNRGGFPSYSKIEIPHKNTGAKRVQRGTHIKNNKQKNTKI